MSSNVKGSEYLMHHKLPHLWCPGCGNGVILGALVRAFANLGLARKDIVVVTGIGCWGRADDYLNTHAFHGTHGRALAFATGMKAVKPGLHVVVLMGDGDCATIGGNHFIHAARRNIGLTAIVSNNFNYGMTGGQYSGTTPQGRITSTSHYGTAEPGFDLCKLAEAAGASYVARSTVYHVNQLEELITEALSRKGFSLIDVINICPTHYGKYNRLGTPVEMLRSLKEKAVASDVYNRMGKEQQREFFVTGKLVDRDIPDFSSVYAQIQRQASGKNA